MHCVLDEPVKRVLLLAHPVGCVYTSLDSPSPETLFGGPWTPIKGRFLIGAGAPENNDDNTSPGSDDYAAGSKGGEAAHTLTENEIPSHKHQMIVATTKFNGEYGMENATGIDANVIWTTTMNISTLSGVLSGASGGGAAHNNLPPYLAVYMWRRTA